MPTAGYDHTTPLERPLVHHLLAEVRHRRLGTGGGLPPSGPVVMKSTGIDPLQPRCATLGKLEGVIGAAGARNNCQY